jgi:hypothetical protein
MSASTQWCHGPSGGTKPAGIVPWAARIASMVAAGSPARAWKRRATLAAAAVDLTRSSPPL